MADEAQDCANKEHMPLVIRYVEQSEIREAFIKLKILCNSGLALSEKIKQAIDDLALEIKIVEGSAMMAPETWPENVLEQLNGSVRNTILLSTPIVLRIG